MSSTPHASVNPDFNSIKVRLEHTQVLNMTSSASFQFHKGAIRTGVVYIDSLTADNFNSIKVRLELLGADIYTTSKLLFQFHKGAIRT